MGTKSTWGIERSLQERQDGTPIGLFRLQVEEGKDPKAYTVKVLSIERATTWCNRAREIVANGDMIPRKVALQRARFESERALERAEIDKMPNTQEKIEALYKLKEGEIAEQSEIDKQQQKLETEYIRELQEHLFEYDPVAIPKEEILAAKPEHSQLSTAFMRLWRFTDPSIAIGLAAQEFAKE